MFNLISWFSNLVNPPVEFHESGELKYPPVGFPNSFADKMASITKEHEEIEWKKYDVLVERLVQEGWQVLIRHKRSFKGTRKTFTRYEYTQKFSGGYSDNVKGNGGVTTVVLISPDGKEYKGQVKCSKSDSFSRKTGRKYAIKNCIDVNFPI